MGRATAEAPRRPGDDSWVVSVHQATANTKPVGTGVVIDETRILTCRHVAVEAAQGIGPGRVRFVNRISKSAARPSVLVVRWEPPLAEVCEDHCDVVVGHLKHPIPDGVTPARLRSPERGDLYAKQWWSFGFGHGNHFGDQATGTVGSEIGFGWLRLSTTSEYVVEPGFSGAGIWSADYEAVVGLVTQVAEDQGPKDGDGRAITFREVIACVLEEKLAALTEWTLADATAQDQDEWGVVATDGSDPGLLPPRRSLADDPAMIEHWGPRARGVTLAAERGWRFRGRRTALEVVRNFLDRPIPPRGPLVVTGSPGIGKSAVVARMVTTADRGIAKQLPAEDTAVRATIGSVSCAVHAKGKTALEVAQVIARAASVRFPEKPEDVEHVASWLAEARNAESGRFNLVIDALDEAATPADARLIATHLVRALAETGANLGIGVVVATRRDDASGSLFDYLQTAPVVVDLDTPALFELSDLEDYALATLRLVGDERPDSPYADPDIAFPVAKGIAGIAKGNFLVTGLTAREHGLFDERPVALDQLGPARSVDEALLRYVARIGAVEAFGPHLSAQDALTVLAFAEAPGFTVELWAKGIEALHETRLEPVVLRRFARSGAASFLVQGFEGSGAPTFRLFHQALNDSLLGERAKEGARATDEAALTRAFLDLARQNWDRAPAYIARSLVGHAHRGHVVDTLLLDDEYLLRADLYRLRSAALEAVSGRARRRQRLIALTPPAATADPATRAAMFSVTDAVERLEVGLASTVAGQPYRARWAQTAPSSELARLEGHTGWVHALAAVPVGDRVLLASVGAYGTVRLWDPASGEERARLEGHTDKVQALAAVPVGDRVLLASGSDDGTVRLWDPASGEERARLEGHTDKVQALAAVPVGDRVLLASGSDDGTVRLWDPASGEERVRLEGHTDKVQALAAVPVGDRVLLASAGAYGTVRLWDPASGEERARLEGHTDKVQALAAVPVGDRVLLASAGAYGTVRLWDPASGEEWSRLEGHTDWVHALAAVPVGDRVLLASGDDDGTVRLWDPASGEEWSRLEGHTEEVYALAAVPVGDRVLLASGSTDGTVRLWDPASGEARARLEGNTGWVRALAAVPVGDRVLLASGGDDGTVRLWDPASGEERARLEGHTDWVQALAAVPVGDRVLLASGSAYGTVQLWDPASGEERARLEGNMGWVHALAAVPVGDRVLLASGSAYGAVRLWDPASGEERARLEGHTDWVHALAAVPVGDRVLLASGSAYGAVRLWDPASGEERARLEGHTDKVQALAAVPVGDRVLLASGGDDGTVRLWDPATGEERARLVGHTDWVRALAAVPVGDRVLLASGSDDGTVRLWDPASRTHRSVVYAHSSVSTLAVIGSGIALGLPTGILMLDLLVIS